MHLKSSVSSGSSLTAVAFFALLLALIALMGAGCSSAQKTSLGAAGNGAHPPVLLISIDGLRPEFYRPGSGWDAPVLTQLAAAGASSDGAEPIYPSLTYPSHASIVTGVRSARHGIASNTLFSITDGPSPLWYWEAEYLRMPTIWQRARAAGYKTAILTWPGTVGAAVDWMIPEIFAAPPLLNGTTWELMHKSMVPAFADELVAVNGGALPSGFGPRDEWITKAAEHVLRDKHPDLALIHIINVDHAEHESGKDSPEAHQALKVADAQIGRILASVDLKRTTVILLGDHGFYDYDKTIRPNVLFAQQGWLKEEAASPSGVTLAKDWKVTTHAEGGAATVYTRDKKLIPRILRLLRRHAGKAYRVLDRAELDKLEAFPDAVCAIEPTTRENGGPGYSVGLEAHGPFIEKLPHVRGNHGPRPTDPGLLTGLIAVGPGIAPGTQLGHVQLIDVAPTIARIVGVPLSEAEGKPIELRR